MVFYDRDQVVNNKEFHLASRGGHANKHPGNKASRQLIRQYAAMYVATKKSERGALARRLYESLFQGQRIFVVERDYFLRCIEDDRKTAQQGRPHDSSRRKLSDERVQSVVGANGGSLASILALPPRVFLPTGDAFAFDTIDHLLRDEAKKCRRRSGVAAAMNQHGQEEGEKQSCDNILPQSFSLDKRSQTSVQLPSETQRVATHLSAAPRSCSVGTIVSVSSENTTKTAPSDQLPSSYPATALTPDTSVLASTNVSWESIHSRKNQSAMSMEQLPDICGAVGFGGFDLNTPQDLNLWKACSEHITGSKEEDLLKPINSSILDNMWSNEQEDGTSSSEEPFSSSDYDDDEELSSLIDNITTKDIQHDGNIDFLDHFAVAMLFDDQEF